MVGVMTPLVFVPTRAADPSLAISAVSVGPLTTVPGVRIVPESPITMHKMEES
jgi:hypothetical protein